jgi:hypothetical protein
MIHKERGRGVTLALCFSFCCCRCGFAHPQAHAHEAENAVAFWRGFDLISDALPFGGLWYTKPDHAIGFAKFYSRSHDAVIRVYDGAGNVIETHEQAGEFKEW